MSDSPQPSTRCRGCTSPLSDEIATRLNAGQSPERVSEWLGRLGERFRLSAQALRRHQTAHLGRRGRAVTETTWRTGDLSKQDFATLIRSVAQERVETGELQPTIGEGLRAQEMLDRRAEKGADRDLMVALAGLLSGATMPVAVSAGPEYLALPDGIDEADWRELRDERDSDLAEFALLAGGGETMIRPHDRRAV